MERIRRSGLRTGNTWSGTTSQPFHTVGACLLLRSLRKVQSRRQHVEDGLAHERESTLEQWTLLAVVHVAEKIQRTIRRRNNRVRLRQRLLETFWPLTSLLGPRLYPEVSLGMRNTVASMFCYHSLHDLLALTWKYSIGIPEVFISPSS